MTDLRENLAAYIRDRGIKQVYIAQKVGLTEAQMGAILNLKRKMDANEFIAICDAIDTSPTVIRQYCISHDRDSA